jgi:hypothetical protein
MVEEGELTAAQGDAVLQEQDARLEREARQREHLREIEHAARARRSEESKAEEKRRNVERILERGRRAVEEAGRQEAARQAAANAPIRSRAERGLAPAWTSSVSNQNELSWMHYDPHQTSNAKSWHAYASSAPAPAAAPPPPQRPPVSPVRRKRGRPILEHPEASHARPEEAPSLNVVAAAAGDPAALVRAQSRKRQQHRRQDVGKVAWDYYYKRNKSKWDSRPGEDLEPLSDTLLHNPQDHYPSWFLEATQSDNVPGWHESLYRPVYGRRRR